MLNKNEQEIQEIKEVREQTEERFIIDDLGKASWAFRKLAAVEAKENEIKQVALDEIERIKVWQQDELKHYSGDRDWLEFLLKEYFTNQIKLDDKFRCKTAYGSISQVKQQPAYKYDDDLIVEALKSTSKADLVKEETISTVNKNDLKKELEIIENIYLIDGEIMEYKILGDTMTVQDTGEVIDLSDERLEYREAVAALDGKVINGVNITLRDPKINIKTI